MTRDALATVLAGPAWIFLVWLLPRYWRNDRALHPDTPPPSWSASGESPGWRAVARAWPAAAGFLLLLLPGFVLSQVAPEGSAASVVGGAVTAVAFIGGFVVVPYVALRNRPSFLVAPAHRALLRNALAFLHPR